MSFASKYNSNERLFKFDTPESFEYKDLRTLANEYGLNEVHRVNAIFINRKGKYGPQPVVATNNELVNLPGHLVDTAEQILKDGESVSLINNGCAGFKLYSYQNKYGTQYSIEWVDIEPEDHPF